MKGQSGKMAFAIRYPSPFRSHAPPLPKREPFYTAPLSIK